MRQLADNLAKGAPWIAGWIISYYCLLNYKKILGSEASQLFSQESLNISDEQHFNDFVSNLQNLAAATFKLDYKLISLVEKAQMIFEAFKTLCESDSTRLIVYQCFAHHSSVKGRFRYQLGLIASDDKDQPVHSLAESRYVIYMLHLLSDLKAPQAALFFVQLMLRMIVEEPGLFEKILTKRRLTPKSDIVRGDWEILSDENDFDSCREYTTGKRSYGRYFPDTKGEDLGKEDIEKIKESLISGHGNIFFHNFNRSNGSIKEIDNNSGFSNSALGASRLFKMMDATRMPSIDLITPWFTEEDHSCKTASSTFNRHLCMYSEDPKEKKGSFIDYYNILENAQVDVNDPEIERIEESVEDTQKALGIKLRYF